MKLRRVVRYLEIIDRQLELLYMNFSEKFKDLSKFSIFWKEMSLEKSDLYSCLSLVEQVGEENLFLSEYEEQEFVELMEKLTQYLRKALSESFTVEAAMDISVEIETQHSLKLLDQLSSLVNESDFKKVINEMGHNRRYRSYLKRFIVEYHPDDVKKQELLDRLESSISES